MGPLFNDLAAWLEALPALWAYVAIFAIAYGENVVPPVPGDLAILYGGYLAGIGKLAFWPVVGLSTLGGVLGFMTLYALGYHAGEAILDARRMRWLPKASIVKARDWMAVMGWWVVLLNRFLSGIRSVISLTVGMARLDARRTALLAGVSAFAWSALIVYAGYALGDNLDVVKGWMATYGKVVGGLLFAGLLVWLGRKAWRRLR